MANANMRGEKGNVFGYARVSSVDQNLDRQLMALADYGVNEEAVYADKASGATFQRSQYKRLKGDLSSGDVLVVKSIDRLGRNYDEILEEWRAITRGIGADIVVLDMPLLDTRERPDGVTGAFIVDIVLQLLSYVAEVERENTRQRQAEGIAAARSRGVRFGRPRKLPPENYPSIRDSYLSGDINQSEAAAQLNVSTSTFYRWMRDEVV